MSDVFNDNQHYAFSDETADVTVRREIIKFYGPALGRATMGTLVFLKDLALRYRENDPDRCEKEEFSLSYSELTNLIGCSREALANDIKKLIELGLLSKVTEKATKSDKKWNETNRYRILSPNFDPTQELVRKYWPSWWIRPDVKSFKIGGSVSELQKQTTTSSSSVSELRVSGSVSELHKKLSGSENRLPESSVVRQPNGNVVVVNLKETTTPDFVAVFLIDEIKRCQKLHPDFNAKTMVRYWKKALEKTFEKPGTNVNDAKTRVISVLNVADSLKKRPNNFLIWFMAGVRDGYESDVSNHPRKLTQEEMEIKQQELRQKREEEEIKSNDQVMKKFEEDRLNADEEGILGAYDFAIKHLKGRGTDPIEHIKKQYAGNIHLEKVLKKLEKRG